MVQGRRSPLCFFIIGNQMFIQTILSKKDISLVQILQWQNSEGCSYRGMAQHAYQVVEHYDEVGVWGISCSTQRNPKGCQNFLCSYQGSRGSIFFYRRTFKQKSIVIDSHSCWYLIRGFLFDTCCLTQFSFHRCPVR